jgi:predicted RecB family nuclease
MKLLRTCKEGHQFYKTSDCPTCPQCEQLKKPADGFLPLLAAPARRALLFHGIDTVEKLAKLTEKEILSFHGMGPASMPILKKALSEAKLNFVKNSKQQSAKN